jgi:hypothetical protein
MVDCGPFNSCQTCHAPASQGGASLNPSQIYNLGAPYISECVWSPADNMCHNLDSHTIFDMRSPAPWLNDFGMRIGAHGPTRKCTEWLAPLPTYNITSFVFALFSHIHIDV